MALIQLDTRVPLMAQAPQIDFNQLANNTLNLYDNIKQRGQQGVLSRLLAQNMGENGQPDLNKALQAVQSNPRQAYQPALVNTLSGLLKQQRAEELKAQQEALKSDAELNKTYAETGKIKNEGVGKGLENSEKRFGALNQIFQAAALSGSKQNILLGLSGALGSGLLDPETYNKQKQIVELMTPDEIKAYAKDISFGNAKDSSSILYQTANNIADNVTSRANNQATVGATMRGQDIVAQTADKNRAQQASQFTQAQSLQKWLAENKPIGTERGSDGFLYAIYPGGKGVRIPDQDGQPINVQPRNGGQMSATAQKELIETTEAIGAGNNAIANLTDALKYSRNAYDGVGASQRATIRGMISGGSEEATATAMLDNITKGNALDQLKATFGGAPTEGERAILLQLQGSANMPKAQREAIYDRALQMAKARLASNQAKAESLRNGSFFKAAPTDSDQGQNLFGLFD